MPTPPTAEETPSADDGVPEASDRPMSVLASVRRSVTLFMLRLQTASVLGFMGAASLIGVEALFVIIGFTTVLPIAIPFVVLILGTAYFARERLRGLRHRVLAGFGRAPEGD
ncbi:hypothetical protein [Glycomyces tarimensis]